MHEQNIEQSTAAIQVHTPCFEMHPYSMQIFMQQNVVMHWKGEKQENSWGKDLIVFGKAPVREDANLSHHRDWVI